MGTSFCGGNKKPFCGFGEEVSGFLKSLSVLRKYSIYDALSFFNMQLREIILNHTKLFMVKNKNPFKSKIVRGSVFAIIVKNTNNKKLHSKRKSFFKWTTST